MISKPLSEIVEIPGPSLNDQLVPANDNHELTALSRENLEAESILAPREYTGPGISPLVVSGGFCLIISMALIFLAFVH